MSKFVRVYDTYEVLTKRYHHRLNIQRKALKKAFDKAPTVDAIPIEWIKEWVNNYCDWSQEQLVECLLRTWRKMNEVRDVKTK